VKETLVIQTVTENACCIHSSLGCGTYGSGTSVEHSPTDETSSRISTQDGGR